jgi:hypothetical protein
VAASRRGRTRETETEGGGVEATDDDGEIDDDELEEEDADGMLHVGDEVATRSDTGIEAAACSEAGVEAAAVAVASMVGGGVWGERRVRALGGFENLLSVERESTGPEILGCGT